METGCASARGLGFDFFEGLVFSFHITNLGYIEGTRFQSVLLPVIFSHAHVERQIILVLGLGPIN